jgi:hypothetical protein
MRGFRADNIQAKRTTAKAASLVVNNVTNATLTVTASATGAAGNALQVRIVTGAPALDGALAAAKSGNVITVTLGTDGAGVLDNAKNTGTLVAAVLDALDDIACTTSGSGAGVVAPVAVQSLSGGFTVMTMAELAKASNCTDELIQSLHNGGNCEIHEASRIAAALSETLSSLGVGLI